VRVRARIDDASVLVEVARVWLDLMVWERSEKLAIFDRSIEPEWKGWCLVSCPTQERIVVGFDGLELQLLGGCYRKFPLRAISGITWLHLFLLI